MTTIDEWAQALLTRGGWPITMEMRIGIAAWAAAEGSQATWNPLDTTEPAPGATNYNFIGVKNYPDMTTGIDATYATLMNGLYSNVIAVLSTEGSNALALAQAVGESPWGTGNFSSVVYQAKIDPNAYLDRVVAGSEPAPPPPPPPAPAPQEVTVQVPQLQQGATGGAVKAVQLLLNGKSGSGLAVDGIFGPLTHTAVVHWQAAHGLVQDGIVGPITWGSLCND